MPRHIEDDVVAELATCHSISKQAAVRLAVQIKFDRMARTMPLREQFAALRAENPLPPPTGKIADKAFFDRLWNGL